MGNSPGGSRRQASDVSLRAHRAVSKMQVLQNSLTQDEIDAVEAQVSQLEQLANDLSRKYAPPPSQVYDEASMLINLPIGERCRVLQFLGSETTFRHVWEILVRLPSLAKHVSRLGAFPLADANCLQSVGEGISLIGPLKRKELSLLRFYHLVRCLGAELVVGACRGQMNKTKLENLVW